jgi:hypothetical protein
MPPLRPDPETDAAVRAVILACQQRGTDVVRALNELGLLWYPAKLRAAQADILGNTADMLRQMSIRQLSEVPVFGSPGAGGLPNTPQETKNLIVNWLITLERELLKP